jgi:hypothetical protein
MSVILAFSTIHAGSEPASDQEAGKSPSVVYLESYTGEIGEIQDAIWNFIKLGAHSNDAKAIEGERRAVIMRIKKLVEFIKEIKPYNNDTILKKAFSDYVNSLLYIMEEDYGKLVNMEEIAEQSYDLMEAYLAAKEKANEKFSAIANEMELKQKEYAALYNIDLIFDESETVKNLREAGRVTNYHDSVYLIFFKSHKQELYLLDAVSHNDISKIEQNRLTLQKYSQEGLKALKNIKPFKNDNSLKIICQKLLSFYSAESMEKMPVMLDFLMKQEAFEKLKKAYELKKEDERTREDVDLYNAKVNEVNEAVKKYNSTVKALNEKRSDLINEWNGVEAVFFDRHVPR